MVYAKRQSGKLCQRLKVLCKSMGISQAKIALLLDSKQPNINRFEHNQSEPLLALLCRYADFFDVSLDYILGRTNQPQGKLYEYKPTYSPERENYSAELSEKIQRGQKENALKCRSNGGNIPLGYVVGTDGVLAVDPLTAPLVAEIFTRYESGETIKAIADSLNKRGFRTRKGSAFRVASLSLILKNRKYIGEYKYADTVVPNGIPAIINPDLFERVQERMLTNKKAPSRTKADEDYLLTTKLFCGDCGRLMAGECGTSGTNGVKYYYYKCGGAKRRLGCKRKAVKKHWIERVAVVTTVERVLQDAEINRIADAIVALQDKEDTTIPALREQLKECEKGIENMLNAIQMGILTASTKTRLEELEARQNNSVSCRQNCKNRNTSKNKGAKTSVPRYR